MDGRKNGWTDGRTDGRTEGQTLSYRHARTHLKRLTQNNIKRRVDEVKER